MKKTMEKLLHRLVIVLILIQPLIDMDYLFYDQLDALGLPRFSTVVRFLVIPSTVLLSFWLREKNKKRAFLIGAAYGILFVVYFAVYLWMTYQRTKDNRAGAVVLAVISMAALVLFMVQTTNMVSEDIKDESNVEIWYDMFTGLHIICFHIIYFCFALRGILAKKEEPET